MASLSEYPKYIKNTIFCTDYTKFGNIDIGNLFFLCGDLYIKVNYPAKRTYARNAVIISSSSPSLCGIGIYVDDSEDVEVVTENSIILRGEALPY